MWQGWKLAALRNWKREAPECAVSLTRIRICEDKATFLWQKNYTPRGIKGALDLVGYDGKTLAFVEVRTRTGKEDVAALPELSVTREEQHVVVRTAQRFHAERHMEECPLRFDVVA